MIIIFVEFIDQLIDYPINRANLSIFGHVLPANLQISLRIFIFITKTRLFKYIEKFSFKNWKFSDTKTPVFFHISAQHIDCCTR